MAQGQTCVPIVTGKDSSQAGKCKLNLQAALRAARRDAKMISIPRQQFHTNSSRSALQKNFAHVSPQDLASEPRGEILRRGSHTRSPSHKSPWG